jgi:flagellar protein FlgJ
MSISAQDANIYTDLNGLEAMRRSADAKSPETLRFVAKQFEALFLQMMLKSARDASIEDGLLDSEQTEFYQDLHDKQLAIELAQGKGMGIADMLARQLGADQSATQDADGVQGDPGRTLMEYISSARSMPLSAQAPAISSNAAGGISRALETPALETPEDFVKHLWPSAKQAADKLGVAPQVLLAQAALETGWGRAVSRHADGRSSHNLFNIKADGRWDGEAVRVATLEYRDGTVVREQAQFRAYDSYAQSFEDYVAFLRESPRYQQALAAGMDGNRFVKELQSAGYATDPAYANKIMGIAEGSPLKNALAELKLS